MHYNSCESHTSKHTLLPGLQSISQHKSTTCFLKTFHHNASFLKAFLVIILSVPENVDPSLNQYMAFKSKQSLFSSSFSLESEERTP